MSLAGKNRKVFSYNNQNRRESNFLYKDFEKTKSYRTDFGKANFSYASLRTAHMKFCNFSGAVFNGTEFVGTNLRGSLFKGASFKNAIFIAAVLDKADFTGATFENCIFCGTKTDDVKGLDNNAPGIQVIVQKPSINDFPTELIEVVQELRINDSIRKSHTLHTKKNGVNTIYLSELLKEYSEEDLINMLPQIERFITTQFYTLSYLKVLLKKVAKNATI